ncbi:MAG TPA: hypothetical protein VGN72_07660 [Tepidisphaeraceae bacterium]|jgi:hypothetical protein|nr:hypothetical protein [Tepidisphaeraceae bacterium]
MTDDRRKFHDATARAITTAARALLDVETAAATRYGRQTRCARLARAAQEAVRALAEGLSRRARVELGPSIDAPQIYGELARPPRPRSPRCKSRDPVK